MPPKKRKTFSPVAATAVAAAAAPAVWTVTGSELIKAFQHIIYSLPHCHDQWFTAEDWCSILPTYWSALRNYEDQVTTQKFIRAIKGHYGDISGDRDEVNPNGVYTVQHGTKKKSRQCFLITKKGNKCPLPPSSPNFIIGNIHQVLLQSSGNNVAVHRRVVVAPQQRPEPPKTPFWNPGQNQSAASIRNETFLDSPEGWRQFMPSSTPYPKKGYQSTGTNVKAMMESRLEVCQAGIQTWYKAVENATQLSEDLITDFKKRRIVIKCHFVYAALKKALDTMGDNTIPHSHRLTWGQCCEYAVESMKAVGFSGMDLMTASTVKTAHVEMREHNNRFLYPTHTQKGKKYKKRKKVGKNNDEEEEDADDDAKIDEEDVVEES